MSTFTRRDFCILGAGATFTALAGSEHMAAAFAAKTGRFTNPIVPGDRPDAGIIRVGDDYYLTHSSFVYTPGLIVWHSRNLVNWTPVSAALTKYAGDVWAPYLCQHGERFYIYYPLDGHLHVVHADSPRGPWSEPIDLNFRAIDPAHLSLSDGRRFLYAAGGMMAELTPDGLATKTPFRKVFEAWPIPDKMRVECECMEAPKIFEKDGCLYLTVAQGGTAGPPTSHMVVSMRSKSPEGPWEFSPHNPIMHTADESSHWWSVGHGRLVQAKDGTWWMTVHAYENGYRSLGRQNLLVPVEWTPQGWFRVTTDITKNAPIAINAEVSPQRTDLSDDFSGPQLKLQWQFFKGYDPARFSFANNALTLRADGKSWLDTSVLGCITGDHAYTVEVDLEIEPECEAGLILFYNNEHCTGLVLGPKGVGLIRNGSLIKMNATPKRATLRVVNDHQQIDMYYRPEGEAWKHVPYAMNVESYEHNSMKKFLDVRPALYSAGSGHATFRAFRYTVGAASPV